MIKTAKAQEAKEEKASGKDEAKATDKPAAEDAAADDKGDAKKDDADKEAKTDDKDGESKGGVEIRREVFLRMVRLYYKVVKDIVLSDGLLIPESGQIRRMMIGEVMECNQGPVIDPTVGVYRIQGRVFKDGIAGWATVLGNQGVTFLAAGGSIYRVLKQVNMSADIKDMEGSIRKLREGEVLQVLDWGRTSRSALGVTRIKARCPDDGTVGWSTIVGNDGTAFLEAV